MTDHRIAVAASDLHVGVKATASAAQRFTDAGSQLRTAIPLDAFGALGHRVAATGNDVGGAISHVLTVLGKVSGVASTGMRAASAEFERIEDEAVARFQKLESDLLG